MGVLGNMTVSKIKSALKPKYVILAVLYLGIVGYVTVSMYQKVI